MKEKAVCCECWYPMQAVRPGKWQCNYCELEDIHNQVCEEVEDLKDEVSTLRKRLADEIRIGRAANRAAKVHSDLQQGVLHGVLEDYHKLRSGILSLAKDAQYL